MNYHIKHLLLSGGGVRGISFIGALKYLEEHNLIESIKTFIGSSIGSLIVSTICIGFTTQELEEIMLITDFNELKNVDIFKMFENYGIDSGKKLVHFIKNIFRIKINPNITFIELYNINQKHLMIPVTCISTHSIFYFDYINTPNVRIYQAIRASMSIPLYYTSVKYDNKYFVDGAILDNLPLYKLKDKKNVVGFKLVNNLINEININSLEEYIMHFFITIFEELERSKNNGINKDIIMIDTKKVSTLDFDISKDDRKFLLKQGYEATKRFILKKNKIKID